MKRSDIGTRLVSALIMAGIALFALLASVWTFALLIVLSGAVVAFEWGRLVRGEGFDAAAIIQIVAVAAVAVLVTIHHQQLAWLSVALGALAIALVTPRQKLWSVGGLLYAAIPAFALVWLHRDPQFGIAAVLYLFAVAWTTDSMSFVGGKLIGGPRLNSRISPMKTWSGLIVGTLAPALVGVIFAFILKETSPLMLALISVILAVACQAGDLGESAVKRRFGTKDMSQLIPGHGGLLDRIDSFLVAAAAAALIAMRDPSSPGRGLLIW